MKFLGRNKNKNKKSLKRNVECVTISLIDRVLNVFISNGEASEPNKSDSRRDEKTEVKHKRRKSIYERKEGNEAEHESDVDVENWKFFRYQGLCKLRFFIL